MRDFKGNEGVMQNRAADPKDAFWTSAFCPPGVNYQRWDLVRPIYDSQGYTLYYSFLETIYDPPEAAPIPVTIPRPFCD